MAETNSSSPSPSSSSGSNNLYAILIFLGVALALCMVCCVSCYAVTLLSPSTTDTNDDAPVDISDEEEEAEEVEPEEESDAETIEEWRSVMKASGSATKKTEPFTITGKRWKVIYTLKPKNDFVVFSIYANEPGEVFGDSVVLSADKSGETLMYTKGEFYLDISSANTSWTVEVQQLVEREN